MAWCGEGRRGVALGSPADAPRVRGGCLPLPCALGHLLPARLPPPACSWPLFSKGPTWGTGGGDLGGAWHYEALLCAIMRYYASHPQVFRSPSLGPLVGPHDACKPAARLPPACRLRAARQMPASWLRAPLTASSLGRYWQPI